MIHELKIWPEFYEAVRSGLKTFEIRKNDRGYQAGDTLRLREYDPNSEEYTGKSIQRRVGYIVEGPPFMPEGLAVLSMVGPFFIMEPVIKPADPERDREPQL